MNAVKTMALVGVVIGALVAWDAFKPEGGLKAVAANVSEHSHPEGSAGGFVDMPLPDGLPARGIVIFAPENCPSEDAKRAERLASRLSDRGLAYQRSTVANWSDLRSQEEADRIKLVMEGDIPIVYVNGRAKANPTFEEVVAEYRRERSS